MKYDSVTDAMQQANAALCPGALGPFLHVDSSETTSQHPPHLSSELWHAATGGAIPGKLEQVLSQLSTHVKAEHLVATVDKYAHNNH